MSTSQRRTAAIIGTGVSGLSAIKACIEEGLEPTAFEKSDTIGGIWKFTDHPSPEDGAGVYENLMTNTSKWMTCFSDFPFPESTKLYLPHNELLEYLLQYAEEFDLIRHIKFQCQVMAVTKTQDYEQTGQWCVTYMTTDTGVHHEVVVDCVFACSGRFQTPWYPHIPGLSDYKGEIMHAAMYRTEDIFKGKRVLFVGNANTAADLAVAAAKTADKVDVSVGRSVWIIKRFLTSSSAPLDYTLTRLTKKYLPQWISTRMMMRMANSLLDHVQHGCVPPDNSRTPYNSAIILSEYFGDLVRTGCINIHRGITKFHETGVLFKDGTSIDVDLVVFATGYKANWTYIPEDVIPDTWEKRSFYRMMIPTTLSQPTLAVIGCMGIFGPIIPVLEMQTRWAAALFTQKLELPSTEDMEAEAAAQNTAILEKYGYMKMSLDSVLYQDKLGGDLGLNPPFLWTLLTRPLDLFRWYVRPVFPALYRLYGRHTWSGAREALSKAYSDGFRTDKRCEF